jgi:hypothetical protein
MVRRFFHSPNTPSFYFLKNPPPRISVIMFQLSYSLSPIHPPFVIILFFLGRGGSSWTPATLQTRAPKHTQESPIATACFGTSTSQTIGSRQSLINKLWAERSIQSSPTKKEKRYGLRIYLSSKRRAESPETDPHIRHEDANHKNGNRLSQGREQSRAEPKNKIRLISCHIS